MSIITLDFFAFLLVNLCIYYIIKPKYRWIVLLLASFLFFVLSCGWQLYSIFLAQTILAWGGVFLMEKSQSQKKKTRIATITIVLEFLVLFLFKENSFFTINTNFVLSLFKVEKKVPRLNLPVPLGISYYTLLLVSYVFDVLWRKTAFEKNPLKLVLYASFFPQMVSGPFTRYGEVKEELFGKRRLTYKNISFGAQRFVWGLFKELILAERLAVIVKTIYDGGTASQMGTVTFEGFYIPLGGFCYAMQLYTNFSGCMDIVLGTAEMFGIKLPENFNTPFYSTSLSEFWRRWHITLGLWLKDYVLYPIQKSLTGKFGVALKEKIGKKHGKNVILYCAMFITWFCIGFWHGGSWKYIFSSGLFFFAMIVGGLILQPFFLWLIKILHINTQTQSWILFQRIRTMLLFTLSLSFGRAASLKYGLKMWSQVFKYNPWIFVDGLLFKLGLDAKDFFVLIFGMIILFVVSKKQQQGSVREIISKQNLIFRWILWLGLLVSVLLFGMYGEGYNPAEFIYGGF